MSNERLVRGRVYRHFKGGLYKLIDFDIVNASNEDDDLFLYVYYYSLSNRTYFVRRQIEFLSEVDKNKYPNATQKYRFELLED